jgi:hypothetical protein
VIRKDPRKSILARQGSYQRFFRKLGIAKAAKALDITPELAERWKKRGVPPSIFGTIRKRIRTHYRSVAGGTPGEKKRGLRDLRDQIKTPPPAPLPKPRPAPVLGPRPSILPPPRLPQPPQLPPIPAGFVPSKPFTDEEWLAVRRDFLQSLYDLYNLPDADPKKAIRISPYLRRSEDGTQLMRGVRVEEFVAHLIETGQMEDIGRRVYESALKVVKRHPGGTLIVKFRAVFPQLSGVYNPFFQDPSLIGLTEKNGCMLYQHNTGSIDTREPTWKTDLFNQIMKILIGPDSPKENSLTTLADIPLLYLRGADINYEDK